MKDKLIKTIREVPIADKTYPEYVEALAEKLIKADGWISVEDCLPDVGADYLVTIKMKYAWETEWEYHTDVASWGCYHDDEIDGEWCTFNDWCEGQEVHITHWMPLPEPCRESEDTE